MPVDRAVTPISFLQSADQAPGAPLDEMAALEVLDRPVQSVLVDHQDGQDPTDDLEHHLRQVCMDATSYMCVYICMCTVKPP